MTSMGQRAPPPEASPYAQPHHFSLSANPDAPKVFKIDEAKKPKGRRAFATLAEPSVIATALAAQPNLDFVINLSDADIALRTLAGMTLGDVKVFDDVGSVPAAVGVRGA